MPYSTFSLDLITYLNDPDMAKYRAFVTSNKLIPEASVEIINCISEYLSWVGGIDRVTDWTQFAGWYNSTKPPLHGLSIGIICSALQGHTSSHTGPAILQSFIDKKFCEDLSLEADEVYSSPPGKYHPSKLDSLQAILDAYHATSVRTNREVAGTDENDVLAALQAANRTGLTWPLDSLNSIIGPINKQLIMVASRPDGGKTTFLAQTGQHMAQQLPEGKVVLWFNNEEAIDRVKQRVVQSALGIPESDIIADPLSAHMEYKKLIGTRIIFVEDANSINKIERYLTKYDAGLVIIDQLYKVQGTFTNKNEMEAERFRQLCEWARNIGKHIAPVIVSNQLDGMAENDKCPSMDRLYGSKTGAQGESDVILMIGRVYAEPDKRWLSTPKNKLTGRVQSAETLLMKDIARFVDI